MTAHGLGDVKFAHYALDLYPVYSNHIIESLARLILWFEETAYVLLNIVMRMQDQYLYLRWCWMEKMHAWIHCPNPLMRPWLRKSLSPTMQVQLDNCAKDNKSIFVFTYCSLLVVKGIFKEVFIYFLLVGHMHNDIDASFGQWSMKLHEEDFPTIPLFIKSYMYVDNALVILHIWLGRC